MSKNKSNRFIIALLSLVMLVPTNVFGYYSEENHNSVSYEGAVTVEQSLTEEKDVIVRESINVFLRNEREELYISQDDEENYTIDKIEITIIKPSMEAVLTAEIGGSTLEFPISLHQATATYNAENTLFGISNEISYGFRVNRFILENEAGLTHLVAPNLELIGKNVFTSVIENIETGDNYFIQFTIEEIDLVGFQNSILRRRTVDFHEDILIHELAQFGNIEVDTIQAQFSDLSNIEYMSVETSTALMRRQYDNHLISEEDLDRIIEHNQMFGPSSAQGSSPLARNLIPNVPDSLYRRRVNGEWSSHLPSSLGLNQRVSGYFIYHMHDSFSHNVLNYVMRFEITTNNNASSQIYINSVTVTHNVWIQFFHSTNRTIIFDDRPANARISITPSIQVQIDSSNGIFTHQAQRARTTASGVSRVAEASWIVAQTLPGRTGRAFGAIQTGREVFTALTNAQRDTGTAPRPTVGNVRESRISHGGVRRPADHLTLELRSINVGSLNNIRVRFTFTPRTH